MRKIVTITLLIICLFVCTYQTYGTQVDDTAISRRYIDTTFVSYDMYELMDNLDGWMDELERLKIQAVIIDAMIAVNDQCGIRWKRGMPENLMRFLNKARERGIRVYVGLVWGMSLGPDFYTGSKSSCIVSQTYNLLTAIRNIEYHPAFSGWYIPDEPPIPCWDVDYVDVINHYRSIVEAIRTFSKKPILISPYFGPCTLVPEINAEKAKRFLDNTGIDILIWQDGVGSFSIEPEVAARNFREIERVIGRNRLWVLIELHNNMCSYTCPNPDYSSASPYRVKRQLQVEGLYGDRIVCWNQTHHMSRYTSQSISNGGVRLKMKYIKKILLGDGRDVE